MKKQIRCSVFETNSSMMHTLQIMSKEDYDKFVEYEEDDDWVWDRCDEVWLNKNDYKEDELEDCDSSFFDEESDYEIQEFTTEHGDVVVAISRAKEDY